MTSAVIGTERLVLRPWREEDRAVFHRLHSDEAVMRFFPVRRSRSEADALMDEWNERHARTGLQFWAAERRSDRTVIGMVGLSNVEDPAIPFAPTVQIGWRLLPQAQSLGLATEGASACLAHAFDNLGLREIVSYCVVENRASEAVMRRLGMRHAGVFDHPAVDPARHRELRKHSLYRITAAEWGATAANPEARRRIEGRRSAPR